MKYLKPFIVLFVVLTACSATSMLASWNQKDVPPHKYGRIAIVVISPNTQTRATVEDALSAQFKSRKINADPTFNTFPMAGQIGQIDIDTAVLQQKIRERVTANHFEGLLTIVLLDKQKEQRYVEGSSISIAAPVYGYPYYGYYSYAYQTVYTSGYYVNSTSYFLESNLYDVASGKLIWTAQTKTENPSSIEAEAPNYARIIVDDLLTKKVIAP
jgi:hypothetical protein